jgi:hypothetical protein
MLFIKFFINSYLSFILNFSFEILPYLSYKKFDCELRKFYFYIMEILIYNSENILFIKTILI